MTNPISGRTPNAAPGGPLPNLRLGLDPRIPAPGYAPRRESQQGQDNEGSLAGHHGRARRLTINNSGADSNCIATENATKAMTDQS